MHNEIGLLSGLIITLITDEGLFSRVTQFMCLKMLVAGFDPADFTATCFRITHFPPLGLWAF